MLTPIGIKEVNIDRSTLREPVRRIEDAGAISYLELVGTNINDCIKVVGVGVKWLLGGLQQAILQETSCD